MSNTFRKDRKGHTFKESLKKTNARYKCRCEKCVGKNNLVDEIAEKQFKTEIKTFT